MLGCWGIGGARAKSGVYRRQLEHGPFAGQSIPSASVDEMANLSLGWHLPPLARQTQDGVDLMPFVLYDQVIMDRMSFDCLLGARPSLEGWKPKSTSVKILEQLASDRHIVLEDYTGRLSTKEAAQLIDDMNVMDLSDPNNPTPTIESLRLWIQFYKDLFGHTDLGLRNFHRAIAALRGDEPIALALDYLYECVSDINRILVLAQELAKRSMTGRITANTTVTSSYAPGSVHTNVHLDELSGNSSTFSCRISPSGVMRSYRISGMTID